jgi:hypothetical protein
MPRCLGGCGAYLEDSTGRHQQGSAVYIREGAGYARLGSMCDSCRNRARGERKLIEETRRKRYSRGA